MKTKQFARTALAAAVLIAIQSTQAAAPATTVYAAAPGIDEIASGAADSNNILLRAGIFDPLVERLETATVGYAATQPGSNYALVQFSGDDAARAELARTGIEFLAYVPNHAWIVRLNGATPESLKATAGVRWADYYSAPLKIDPRLWMSQRSELKQQIPEGSISEQDLMDVVDVRGFRGVTSSQLGAAISKLVPNARLLARSERIDATPYIHVAVDRADLDKLLQALANLEGVFFIEPWLPTHVHNSGNVGALQGNATGPCAGSGVICGPAPIFAQGIFGSGQIVAVADSGTTPWAAWFSTLDKGAGPLTAITTSQNPAPVPPATGTLNPNNKIIAYWLQPSSTGAVPVEYDYTSGHGTHTTGTVLGDAAGTFGAVTYVASTPSVVNHELADGMAPNAQLLFQDIGGTSATAVYVNDFSGTLRQAYNGGARVHNNSWGSSSAGQYSGNDADADNVTFSNEDLLVVVSAGNDDPGPVQTGTPSNAKNVLSIAALNRAGSTVRASYSNQGPAADGRVKPDISSPGGSGAGLIQSADNGTSFSAVPTAPLVVGNAGTSMAAPALSGAAALMRQYFADGYYPRGVKTTADAYNPSGVIIKAALLNGTNPLGGTSWPNPQTGWGRAWLDGNLWFKTTMPGGDDTRRTRIFERTNTSGLRTGQTHEYTLGNVAAGSELRTTLTWFDPEGAVSAAMALVNNLDLEVVAPGGTIYKGNVFTGGVSSAGGTADLRDTVEQVRLSAPITGSYTLRVKGTSIPGNGSAETNVQGYGLVVSGGIAMPDPAPFASPTSVTVVSNTAAGVAIGFSSSAAPGGFQLYRATGSCAIAAAGDFRLVGSSPASPVTDSSSQGGSTYAYKLRGVSGDVEGLVSTCIDVVSADDCTLQPLIPRSSLAATAANNSCAVNLTWQAGSGTCPAATSRTYSVQRATNPAMSDAVTVASGIAGTSYNDSTVVSNKAYYYRYFATDNLGNASPYSRIVAATPTSALGPDPQFSDGADNATYLRTDADWGITSQAASEGSLSYHTGGELLRHPDLTCSSIETPALMLSAGAGLSFQARYDLEYQWDGVVMEISTNNGATWTSLAPTGGYPANFAQTTATPINACGYPASQGAFGGVTTVASNANPNNGTAVAVFKPFAADLSAYAGQTIKLRWRLSSDPGANFAGFFLDEVRIGNLDIMLRNGFDQSQYMCTAP